MQVNRGNATSIHLPQFILKINAANIFQNTSLHSAVILNKAQSRFMTGVHKFSREIHEFYGHQID